MKDTSIDDPQASLDHAAIIRKKYALNQLYTEYYLHFKNSIAAIKGGKVLELGSGGGFIKEVIPDAITSDVVPISGCDLVVFAEKLPFENESLKAILMIDVLHHVKTPEEFFNEALRCLVPGGKIIMVEPANTLWAKFIWKTFHHEPFDDKAGWIIKGEGRMSDANIAFPWILFGRDRTLFENKFPQLKINSLKIHTPVAYILSGGVKPWNLLPKFLFAPVRFIEKTVSGLKQGMFQTIEVEKISTR